MERIANFFLDDGDFPERTQKLLGLIFLSLAIFLAFQDYESKFLFFIQKTNSLKPGFASGIFGLLLLSPMYLRGIYRWRPSVYGVTQFILLLTVVSSFISVILPRSLTGTMFLIVCFLVVLAWLGIKDIAKNVWILLAGIAVYQAAIKSDAMGIWGYLYFVCAVLGLGFTGRFSPTELIRGLKTEYAVTKEKRENIG